MRTDNLSSPEELLLAAIGDGKRRLMCGYLSYGLAGAALGELLLAGNLAIADKRVVVRNTAPTGNEVLDWVMSRLRESSKERKLSSWITRLGNTSYLRHLTRLVLMKRGLVRAEEKRIFGLIPHTVYSVPDPAVIAAIRRRVLASLRDLANAPTRDLLELGISAQISTGVLTGEEKKLGKAALKRISEQNPAVRAVKQVIEEMDSAAAVAATLTVVSG